MLNSSIINYSMYILDSALNDLSENHISVPKISIVEKCSKDLEMSVFAP
jgi:hypothetical protein